MDEISLLSSSVNQVIKFNLLDTMKKSAFGERLRRWILAKNHHKYNEEQLINVKRKEGA
jgi:hypothetical protein